MIQIIHNSFLILAAVQEQVNLWNSNKRLDEVTGEKTAQKREDLLSDLEDQGLLTPEEIAEVKVTD